MAFPPRHKREVLSMQRNTAGFVGGLAGGLIRLALDQIAFVGGISGVNTVGLFSGLLATTSALWSWAVYGLVTGVIGWLISLIVPKDYPSSYLPSGLLIGAVLWAGMNALFALSGLVRPTWSMGAGSLVTDLITHFVWGVAIAYGLWRTRVETVDRQRI
jgi:uncharacterized membrane protein YagU involved in acid resistance